MTHKISWVQRSNKPAQCPPDEDYPYGIAINIAGSNMPACEIKLDYPAPGVGSWVIVCETCGYKTVVTAAGRPDDPTKIRVPCNPHPV
jgi:hypothetical protein